MNLRAGWPVRLCWKTTHRLVLVVLLCTVMFAAIGPSHPAQAESALPPEAPPERWTVMTVTGDYFLWYLARWKDSQVVCQMYYDHPGLPPSELIQSTCGNQTYIAWLDSDSCSLPRSMYSYCKGFYLFLAQTGSGPYPVTVPLPVPVVQAEVPGCAVQGDRLLCDTLPTLEMTGVEPLLDQRITSIHWQVGNRQGFCDQARCSLPLWVTGPRGEPISIWAHSSYGDTSRRYNLKMRVVEQEGRWWVDGLGDAYLGPQPGGCAGLWNALPEVGGPSLWLTTPPDPYELQSSVSYYYLAGMMIHQGMVDARTCPAGGLASTEPLIANQCGVEAAWLEMGKWQNQFDKNIFLAAKQTGVPAHLMKGIFARESQFWPGSYPYAFEAGLGQLTENGADSLLLWNKPFYRTFCPSVLSRAVCASGYVNLEKDEQNLLRGALVGRVNAACIGCAGGVDPDQAYASVDIFANSLVASCAQTGQVIRNTTLNEPGQVSSYEDLWKMTLVNYHAGTGCLVNAVKDAWTVGQKLDWTTVTGSLSSECASAIMYVEDITRLAVPVR